MLKAEGVTNEEFLEYKGRPLVRQGDDIYYGDLTDSYYVYMMIMGDKKSPKSGEDIPGTIMVQLLDGKTKKPKRVHHHLVVNAGTQDAFLKAWEKFGLGGVSWTPLRENQIDRTPIAEYIIEQVRQIPNAKSFRHTKNIARPVPKNRIVDTDNELLVPRGGKLIYRMENRNHSDCREVYRNYQPQYIRYITPKALRRMEEKRQAAKEA